LAVLAGSELVKGRALAFVERPTPDTQNILSVCRIETEVLLVILVNIAGAR